MSRCYALPICFRVDSDVLLFIPTTLYFDTYDITSSQRQQRILDKEMREKRRRLTTRQTARRQHLKSPLYPFLTQASGPKSSAVLSSPNQTSSPLSRLVACRTILLQGYNSSSDSVCTHSMHCLCLPVRLVRCSTRHMEL
jgi:hypothetical protein